MLVDRHTEDDAFCSVAVDDVEGGHLAGAHLTSIGRRRIAFVGGPPSIRQVADRLLGARRAVDATPGASLEVIEMTALTVLEGRRAGEAIVSRVAGGPARRDLRGERPARRRPPAGPRDER